MEKITSGKIHQGERNKEIVVRIIKKEDKTHLDYSCSVIQIEEDYIKLYFSGASESFMYEEYYWTLNLDWKE